MEKAKTAAVVLCVLAATGGGLLNKAMYQEEAVGLDGRTKPFAKPWAQTIIMFLGMALCLPVAYLTECACRSRSEPAPLLSRYGSSGLESLLGAADSWWDKYDIILVPTCFDLAATILLSVGLLHTSLSVYQMVRGTEILFTAGLTRLFLRRRLCWSDRGGLCLTLLGVILVGAAALLEHVNGKGPESDSDSASSRSPSVADTTTGLVLIVLAEMVQASQVVVEDYLMSSAPVKLNFIKIVGYEGLFGLMLCFAIFIPAAQFSRVGHEGNGLREDSIDTLAMLRDSLELRVMACVSVLTCAVYNVAGMYLTNWMGALSRIVAETMHTFLVWVLDLILFWSSSGRLGEVWGPYSWLQALGFGVMVVGNIIYAHEDSRNAEEVKARARAHWTSLRERVLGSPRPRDGVLNEPENVVRRGRICGPSHIRSSVWVQCACKLIVGTPCDAPGDQAGEDSSLLPRPCPCEQLLGLQLCDCEGRNIRPGSEPQAGVVVR